MSETSVLRLRHDRLDLGFLAADVLTVEAADTAQPGQIVVSVNPDGTTRVCWTEEADRIIGRVTHMHRRVLGVVS